MTANTYAAVWHEGELRPCRVSLGTPSSEPRGLGIRSGYGWRSVEVFEVGGDDLTDELRADALADIEAALEEMAR